MCGFRIMLRSILFAALAATPSWAVTPDDIDPNLPQHELVCVGGNVSKRQLAAVLLVNAKDYDAIIAVSRGPELWHTIFTDDNFCKVPKSCEKEPNSDTCKVAAKCQTAKAIAVDAAYSFFTSLNIETKRPNASYTEGGRLLALGQKNVGDQISLFFSDPRDTVDPISCTAAKVRTAQPGFDPTKDPVLSKIRARGLSDDLHRSEPSCFQRHHPCDRILHV